MKSLKDFYLFEDEDKFVSIEYNTTKEDDVKLAGSIYNDIDKDKDEFSSSSNDNDDMLPGGADLKLVGEIRLYSETSDIFKDRKRKIADVFKSKLKNDEITANRIKYTKIFDYYINHLLVYYTKNIDKNCRINISTKDELRRQIADDFVMIIKDKEIFNKI